MILRPNRLDKPLLIGEAPPPESRDTTPLAGRPAMVLCHCARIPSPLGSLGSTYANWTVALYNHFDCANVFDEHADAAPWRHHRARAVVRDNAHKLYGRVVVCLGRRVQDAVYRGMRVNADPRSWTSLPPYREWTYAYDDLPFERDEQIMVTTIPHPSGLNRMFNEPVERVRVGETLSRALALAEQWRFVKMDEARQVDRVEV